MTIIHICLSLGAVSGCYPRNVPCLTTSAK